MREITAMMMKELMERSMAVTVYDRDVMLPAGLRRRLPHAAGDATDHDLFIVQPIRQRCRPFPG
jgi:hypothetical protein